MFHPFKGTIIHRYIVTTSCILISRHDHVLSFICIYFESNLLTSNYQGWYTKAVRKSRGIALLFHDLGTRWGWVVSVTSRPPLPPGKTRYPLFRRLGGPQGRSGRVQKISPRRDSIPGPSNY